MRLHLLYACLWLSSCQTQTHLDNQTDIEALDSLPISETRFELELDSNGQVQDTISIIHLKFNHAGDKVYQRYEGQNPSEIRITSYYREPGGIFFQKTDLPDSQGMSYYETLVKPDGRIDKAFYIFDSGEVRDTQFMEFQYVHRDDGTKEEIRIRSRSIDGEGLNIDTYDQQEKLQSSVMILESDTIHIEERYYQDTVLQKIVDRALISEPPLSISYYNGSGKLEAEKSFAGLDQETEVLFLTTYTYDAEGELSGKIEEDFMAGKKRYFKYIRQKERAK